jgi:hypothetical protein
VLSSMPIGAPERSQSGSSQLRPFIGRPVGNERTTAFGHVDQAAKRPGLEAVAGGQILLPEPVGRLSNAPHRLAERQLLGLGDLQTYRFHALSHRSRHSSGKSARQLPTLLLSDYLHGRSAASILSGACGALSQSHENKQPPVQAHRASKSCLIKPRYRGFTRVR